MGRALYYIFFPGRAHGGYHACLSIAALHRRGEYWHLLEARYPGNMQKSSFSPESVILPYDAHPNFRASQNVGHDIDVNRELLVDGGAGASHP